jgi:hypothetical protein
MTALKADQVAADRLLKAAVRRARMVFCVYRDEADRESVVAMLTAAGESAELLLGEGSR